MGLFPWLRLCTGTPVSATQKNLHKVLSDSPRYGKRQSLSLSKHPCGTRTGHRYRVSACSGKRSLSCWAELCATSSPSRAPHSGQASICWRWAQPELCQLSHADCLAMLTLWCGIFFKASKAAHFTPNEKQSSWWRRQHCAAAKVVGIFLPRAVTPGVPFPHRREMPVHCRTSLLLVWHAPKCQDAPSSHEGTLFWSYCPWKYRPSKQQWQLYRL